jgi:hypothetical protein
MLIFKNWYLKLFYTALFFGGSVVWTQGLILARKLYHLSCTSNPKIFILEKYWKLEKNKHNVSSDFLFQWKTKYSELFQEEISTNLGQEK